MLILIFTFPTGIWRWRWITYGSLVTINFHTCWWTHMVCWLDWEQNMKCKKYSFQCPRYESTFCIEGQYLRMSPVIFTTSLFKPAISLATAPAWPLSYTNTGQTSLLYHTWYWTISRITWQPLSHSVSECWLFTCILLSHTIKCVWIPFLDVPPLNCMTTDSCEMTAVTWQCMGNWWDCPNDTRSRCFAVCESVPVPTQHPISINSNRSSCLFYRVQINGQIFYSARYGRVVKVMGTHWPELKSN